jgi:hypothetical protein
MEAAEDLFLDGQRLLVVLFSFLFKGSGTFIKGMQMTRIGMDQGMTYGEFAAFEVEFGEVGEEAGGEGVVGAEGVDPRIVCEAVQLLRLLVLALLEIHPSKEDLRLRLHPGLRTHEANYSEQSKSRRKKKKILCHSPSFFFSLFRLFLRRCLPSASPRVRMMRLGRGRKSDCNGA